mmetsp:Transcript_42351/g.128469  ORF Transcript_42351/g.128469 Transcript_42351/m.128469 type:complete len:236 (-) Transcript_42351:638-1345(-)
MTMGIDEIFSPFDYTSPASIPDDLILRVASYLPAPALASFQLSSCRLHRLVDEADRCLWRRLCERRWDRWPLYRLKPSRLAWMDAELGPADEAASNWRRRYMWAERDVRRRTTSLSELEGLNWFFNFTDSAGGKGGESLSRCHFTNDAVLCVLAPPHPPGAPLRPPFVLAYAPLSCELLDGDGPGAQRLRIADFPLHDIGRISEDGQWIITNENVTIVSTDDEGTLNYTGRNFQG